jgi:predicted dehydrogenase
MAVRAGKDVICEKPLTLTVAEGRALSDEVARYGRIFQTSSENRTVPTYRRMCELVRNGRIGKLRCIEVGLPGAWGIKSANTTPSDPPKGFDYDFWLGQAPWKPYCESRCHWNFRWIMDYSAGQLTDWGAHLIDIAQWGHNTELTGPVAVEGTGTIPEHPVFNTFGTFDLHYMYADGVELQVKTAQPSIRFEGSDGWIESVGWRAAMKASSEELLYEPLGAKDLRLYYAPEDGEHRNFLDCVRSRRQCYGPAEVGHRTISIAHIGNISLQLGRKLIWNPEMEQFAGDEAANRMLTRAMREPWCL